MIHALHAESGQAPDLPAQGWLKSSGSNAGYRRNEVAFHLIVASWVAGGGMLSPGRLIANVFKKVETNAAPAASHLPSV
jgi:hypothetical protein